MRQADDGRNLSDLLQQEINEALPGVFKSLTDVVKGKGQQELAKVQEIKANILKIVLLLDIERQRCDIERQNSDIERQRSKDEHLEKTYQLKTERLQGKAESLRVIMSCIEYLQKMGNNTKLAEETQKAFAHVIADIGETRV